MPIFRCVDKMWSLSSVPFGGRVVTRGSRMKHPRWGAGDVHKMRIFYPQALSRAQNKRCVVVVIVYCYLRIHICTKITTAKVRADAIFVFMPRT